MIVPYACDGNPPGAADRPAYSPYPVAIVTLKNRTLSPLARLFVEQVRAFISSMYAE
jgi:hypothetical protein